MNLRFFLAGIMQGSHLGQALHSQSYRDRLKELLARHFPESDVYDPLADHSDSVDYDDQRGRQVFERHNRMCAEVDVVIAFVPQASMGTAIEMWEAWNNGTFVAAISPLAHNWVIRFCADVVYPDLDAFDADVRSGRFAAILRKGRS
jgi:hypothetical protein